MATRPSDRAVIKVKFSFWEARRTVKYEAVTKFRQLLSPLGEKSRAPGGVAIQKPCDYLFLYEVIHSKTEVLSILAKMSVIMAKGVAKASD